MAITIDYSDPAQRVINIPRADMTLIATVPAELRQLNLDDLRIELGDLQDDAAGVWATTAFFHTPPLTISGVTLARVVEILDPYVIEFEDALYNVNIVGGNSNVSDKTIKNQVGVNTANSAGLQDPFSLQAAAFEGRVSLDMSSSITGTTFPKGTRAFPVNNLADALSIAETRGLAAIQLLSDSIFGSEDFSSGYTFIGDNPNILLTLLSGVNITNCQFLTMTVQGVLDGANTLRECAIININLFNGFIFQCGLSGTIILSGAADAVILQSFSLVAGGGPGQYPCIDLGGTHITPLTVRDWQGGLCIKNVNDVTANAGVSIDMSSGRVIFESNVTAGTYTVRGIAQVTDESTGTATIIDHTLSKDVALSSYQGVIHINTKTGTAGTTIGVNGTPETPTLTLSDAIILAEAIGIRKLHLVGNITLSSAHDDYIFEGDAAEAAVNINGQDVADSLFRNCQLSGAIGTGPIKAEECVLDGVGNFTGIAQQCGLLNETTLGAGVSTFSHCSSEVPGTGTPSLDLGGSASLNMRAYSGGIEIKNVSNVSQSVTLEFIAGQAILASTCSAGAITLRGVGNLTNNSTGVTIEKNAFLNIDAIWGEVVDGTVSAKEALQYVLAMAAGEFTEAVINGTTKDFTFQKRDGSPLFTGRIEDGVGRTRTLG